MTCLLPVKHHQDITINFHRLNQAEIIDILLVLNNGIRWSATGYLYGKLPTCYNYLIMLNNLLPVMARRTRYPKSNLDPLTISFPCRDAVRTYENLSNIRCLFDCCHVPRQSLEFSAKSSAWFYVRPRNEGKFPSGYSPAYNPINLIFSPEVHKEHTFSSR